MILYFSGMLIMERLLTVPPELKPEIEAAFPVDLRLYCLLHWSPVLDMCALEVTRAVPSGQYPASGGNDGWTEWIPALCAVFMSPSLAIVIPAAVLSRGSFPSCLFLALSGAPSAWLFNAHEPRPETVQRASGYGGWVSVTNIVGPILTSLDQMVIGSVILAWQLSRIIRCR